MRREVLGWTGASVPVVGQGTYRMESDRADDAIAALKAGLDLGMTHVDTAEHYGGGRVEARERSSGFRVLADIAKNHEATPRQVALKFLIRQKNLFAIPKASTVAHVADNARAAALVLSQDELGRIDAAFPVAKDRGFLATN